MKDLQMPFEEAEDFFADFFRGKHHIPNKIKPAGFGWSVTSGNDMATYDFNAMTRLVVMAHDRCVRVEIDNGGPRMLKIKITKRFRDEKAMMMGHPTLEDHVQQIRAHLKKP